MSSATCRDALASFRCAGDAFCSLFLPTMSLSNAHSAFRRAATLPKRLSLRALSTEAPAPASSVTPSAQPPRFNLPAEKLRQLISLYHQSRDFVTRENLEKKIDEAFVETPINNKNDKDELKLKSYPDLIMQAAKRRQQPAVRPLAAVSQAQNATQNGVRAVAVFEALYGTSNGRKPGLELVLETWGSTSKRLEELEEEKAASTPMPEGRSTPAARRKCKETGSSPPFTYALHRLVISVLSGCSFYMLACRLFGACIIRQSTLLRAGRLLVGSFKAPTSK